MKYKILYIYLLISYHGHLGYPFHETDEIAAHFTKWGISQMGYNIYMVLDYKNVCIYVQFSMGLFFSLYGG